MISVKCCFLPDFMNSSEFLTLNKFQQIFVAWSLLASHWNYIRLIYPKFVWFMSKMFGWKVDKEMWAKQNQNENKYAN